MREFVERGLTLTVLGLILTVAGACQTLQEKPFSALAVGDNAGLAAPAPGQLLPRQRPVPPPSSRLESWYFTVYFATSETAINDAGRLAISRLVAYAGTGKPSKIWITGHADTAGSVITNQRLSERRARAVADAVIASGVSASLIQISGSGEMQLAKASADGVAEQLNRRVEINITF